MPTGYTYKARIGAVQTINGSATLYGTWQLGRRAQYVVGLAQTATAVAMISGISGAPATPTWTAVALARFVPPTASQIRVSAHNPASSNVTIAVAPNSSYGAHTSTTNPPPLSIVSNGSAAFTSNVTADMLLESTNVYYAADGAACALFVSGWEDNI